MEQEPHVLSEIADGVGTITLNRPDRRNALSVEMIEGLGSTLEAMAASSEVGAVVIRGAGRAFCSGGDVRDFDERGGEGNGAEHVDPDAIRAQQEHQRRTVGALHRFPKPVLASIGGAAAGAGLGLALAADLRIGTPRSVFATAFAGVGLAGDFGAAWLLHHLVGPAKARELMFLSPRVRGEEALGLGLLNWLVEEDDLDERTAQLARQLAEGPSHALEGMKLNLLQAPLVDLDSSMDTEVPRHKQTGLTADHIAAVRAFVDKQTPTFPRGWHTP